ncbi:MAG: acyltransferase [Alcaligenaceae bacterium]|nr:MAG: acyltransferase [Alcaligenaceae bacterium]
MHAMTTATGDLGTPASRVEYLDGVRAASALFVLFHHAMMMAFPVALGVRADGWIGAVFGWAVYGHFGVTVFIVLAGYSLALGVADKSGELPGGLLSFIKRRAMRIVPAYWVALAMTMLLVTIYIGRPTGTHWDLSVPTSYKGWIVNALLIQDIVKAQNVAYTFWSISVEWHIYLLLPIILLVRRRSTWPTAIAIGAGIGIAGLALTFVDQRFERFYFSYYVLFALAVGACVGIRQDARWLSIVPWRTGGMVVASVVVSLCVVKPFDWVSANFYWVDLLFGLAVICLIVSMARGTSPRLVSVFSWRRFTAVGAFSYSLYLIHAPLLQVLWQVGREQFDLDRGEQLAMLWLVACPIILAFSYGFYRVAEKPFLPKRTAGPMQSAVERAPIPPS